MKSLQLMSQSSRNPRAEKAGGRSKGLSAEVKGGKSSKKKVQELTRYRKDPIVSIIELYT